MSEGAACHREETRLLKWLKMLSRKPEMGGKKSPGKLSISWHLNGDLMENHSSDDESVFFQDAQVG